ncbi:MAG: efflux RND transporter periplasmic adaptor subunit [Flavobacteriales bacterium]
MKIKFIAITVLASSFLVGCGSKETNTPLGDLLNKKSEFESKIASLEDSLNRVEAKILEMDSTKENNYPLVSLDTVSNNSISEDVTFQGSVEADKTIMLGPETQGMVKAINVKEGQYVYAGKTLATLDSEILNKNIKEIEKSLELAEYLLEKQENLKKQGIGAEANFIQAKNQVELLESRLSTLKTQASKSRVVAPFSGYVDEIYTKLGEMASPAMPMMRIVNLDKVKVKAEVSEAYLMDIEVGNKVSMNFPSLNNKVIEAKVSSIGKYINPTNRTFPIQIEVSNKDKAIIPNLIAEVTVEKDFTQNAIIIPSQSVLTDSEGSKYVYVYENGIAKMRSVVVLYVKGNKTQISEKSEVKAGQTIITKGASAVSDGQKVTEL